MAQISNSTYLRESVENYYQFNPDTLMPLLMLTLAANGRLKVSNEAPNTGEKVFCTLNLDEMSAYDWVKSNVALRNRMKSNLKEGVKEISLVGNIPDEISDIYDIFKQYDTVTVEQEYHHRIGVLYHHSSNEAEENAYRKYTTVILAEAMLKCDKEWLNDSFISIANHILVKSGLQPERPRIRVGEALAELLKFNGDGKVYNPFAGCAIAAAMLSAGNRLYVDGDRNDKILAASRLMTYGENGYSANVDLRDSTQWMSETPDYVLSTYRGYIEGKSAFDFCLGKCLETFKDHGRFAGIVSPKDIFEKRSPEMSEALDRDWVETIALLPFGEVAVLINAAKTDYKKKIRVFNMTHPMLRRRHFSFVFGNDRYADIVKVSDAKKKDFLKKLVSPEIEDREGFELVRLGDYIKKLPKKTYSLNNTPENEKVMAFVEKQEDYDQFTNPWMNGIDKTPINTLFTPAYRLDRDCLILNASGELQPRLFDAEQGTAFFQNGFAFSLDDFDFDNLRWLIGELNDSYVQRQLHPYGADALLPEKITEEQILELKLYKPCLEEENESNADDDKLPSGQVIKVDKAEYTIHGFLGHGYFGYTYSALSHNLETGEQKEVVLKEFYPYRFYHREGIKAVLNDVDDAVFISQNGEKFKEEGRIMNKLGNTPDSHIVPAFESFHCEETGTDYYVMPFYSDGSLQDLQRSGFEFSEDMVIQHVVIPMCKALNISHKEKVLHLDIKPENILVDEQGDAVLIDFGVAKQYDENDRIINREGCTSSSPFASPELQTEGGMVRFGAQTDIFGLAGTIYYLFSIPDYPHPIMDFSDQDEDIRENLESAGCSKAFADAIVSGLQFSASSRPANAQAFLNMFPGCEDIKL